MVESGIIYFFNQHSFVIVALAFLAITAGLLFRDGIKASDLLALAALTAALLVAWLAVRPGRGTPDNAARAQALIGAGTPVLLELQSPY